MTELSSWASRIRPQPMFDILSKANNQELSGSYVARMEIGDTPGFHNKRIHELLEVFSREPHRYSPSKGEPLLIDGVFESQWPTYSRTENDVTIAPANFLITAALAAITSPGDLVLIPDPGFPTYKLACDFLGLRTETYLLYPNPHNIFPDLSKESRSSTEIPKVIIINNPSNPMGIAFDGYQVRNAIEPLIRQGVQTIIDETYINLVYNLVDPTIENLDAIRIRTFSKEHCAPGLRIGYVLANHKFSKIIADFVSLTISCTPKFIQLAIAKYLQDGEGLLFQNEVHEEMRKRFDLLAGILPGEALITKPNAAFYALVQTGNAEESFEFFLQNNVATCPGSRFGISAAGALRVSIAGKRESFQKDLEMLAQAQKKWSIWSS